MDTQTTRLRRAASARAPLQERSFAVLFGVLFFAILSLPLWGAWLLPTMLAYLLVVYDVYWTFQAIYGAASGVVSYRRLQAWLKIDWHARYTATGKAVQQVIIIPNYAERVEVLTATLERLAQSAYPCEQLHIVLAMEEREAGAQTKAESLCAQFASRFGHSWATIHPLLAREKAGKGSNLAYAARQLSKFAHELGWDSSRVMVTTLDADARLHPHYLAALSVQFLSAPNPTRKFFQGIMLILNNIWDVRAVIRAFSAFWTFGYVTGATHYARLTTAIYSTSLRLLEDINYWDPAVLIEDGHVFFRAFFKLKGRVDVLPIYLTAGLDAIGSHRLRDALSAQYQQMSRWAWTVSNLPFVAAQWTKHGDISLARKFRKCFPYIETLLFMPASWFVITFGALLPPFINPAVRLDIMGVPLALISSLILAPSAIGILAGLAINIKLRQQFAPRPQPLSRIRRILYWSEWLLLPLAGVFYFSLPYIQAYLRLMRGKELPYVTTPK
jgi:cellulose synthase/poly-beta-1,6-N-acetylglucosamine synthase-like glycosyltransferase